MINWKEGDFSFCLRFRQTHSERQNRVVRHIFMVHTPHLLLHKYFVYCEFCSCRNKTEQNGTDRPKNQLKFSPYNSRKKGREEKYGIFRVLFNQNRMLCSYSRSGMNISNTARATAIMHNICRMEKRMRKRGMTSESNRVSGRVAEEKKQPPLKHSMLLQIILSIYSTHLKKINSDRIECVI